jgi:hypothetical protein
VRQSADDQRMAYAAFGIDTAALPRRYFFERPEDNGAFVLPLKQSFVKDARLCPGTRCMLALLTGWAGTGQALRVTQGTIAKHLRRSVRQVFRYLKDAAREGYLRYGYTKNRLGMITGLQIYLCFDRIRPNLKKRRAGGGKPARTLMADTNTSIKDSIYSDPEIETRLERLREAAGFPSG